MTTPQEPHVRPFAEFLRDAFGQVLDVIREAARAEFVEMSQRHAEEIAAMARHLEVAQRIGLRVMLARRKGRKTVRIADVVTEAEAAS